MYRRCHKTEILLSEYHVKLLQNLGETRRQRWTDTVKSIVFRDSSNKGYSLLCKFGDQIRNCIVSLFETLSDKENTREVKKVLNKEVSCTKELQM